MSKQVLVLLAILSYILFRAFFIEPNSLVVTNYKIENRDLSGIRVAFLSDLHLKKRDYNRLNKIAIMTNKQSPDVIILGGDFLNEQNYKKAMNPTLIAQKLSMLNIPVYGVLGQQDWMTDGEKISEAFKDHWAIPDVAYYMIVTGESTGDLANMMQKVSEYYQLLHKNIINNLKSFIEPIMISFLAIIVGVIIIAVIVPMFDMYGQIS